MTVSEENIKELVITQVEEEMYIEQNQLEDDVVESGNKEIRCESKDLTIREYAMMKTDGDLNLQPEYQRNYVMDKAKASKLVESVLMDIPLPIIYLAEEQDGTYSVIDGQQRLTSFISFLDGKVYGTQDDFKLSSLKILTELNRKTFADLPKELQIKIKTTTIRSIIIKNTSDPDIKFEIFERLNTGSVKLNEDEVRNSVYRGPLMNLLAKLEDDTIYNDLVRKTNYKNRMVYRGMILRFFALGEKTYLNYKPSVKQFCNKYLRDNKDASNEKLQELEKNFKHCAECVNSVFGSKAFRRFIPGNDENSNGEWSMNMINMALYDIQMCGFLNYTKNQIIPNSDAIREKLLQLMTNNERFRDSILIKTSGKDEMRIRFEVWHQALREILSGTQTERTFSGELKRKLFTINPTCQICKQQVQSLDDCEVDHIVPFSQGGLTEESNAQVTHRYCNRRKGNRDMS